MSSSGTLTLTKIPTIQHGLGALYRSPMPFPLMLRTSRQQDSTISKSAVNAIASIKSQEIALIVLLMPEDEYLYKAGFDLKKAYEDQEIAVEHLPIRDFHVPELSVLAVTVDKIIRFLMGGQNVLVHCSAGIGRTGLVVSCTLAKLEHLTAQQALTKVRKYIGGAVENQTQRDRLKQFVQIQSQTELKFSPSCTVVKPDRDGFDPALQENLLPAHEKTVEQETPTCLSVCAIN